MPSLDSSSCSYLIKLARQQVVIIREYEVSKLDSLLYSKPLSQSVYRHYRVGAGIEKKLKRDREESFFFKIAFVT